MTGGRGGRVAALLVGAALVGVALWRLQGGMTGETHAPGESGPNPAAAVRSAPGSPAPVVAPRDDAAAPPAPAILALDSGLEIAGIRFTMPSGERGQSLSGLVLDAALRPLPGARVELLDLGSGVGSLAADVRFDIMRTPPAELLAETTTGSDGRFVLLVAESRARVHRHMLPGARSAPLCLPVLRASYPGSQSVVRMLGAGNEESVDVGTLILGTGGSVRGRVQFASGQPAPGARVRLRSWVPADGAHEIESMAVNAALGTHTDADGRWHAAGLPAARLSVEIDLEGWTILRPEQIQVLAGTETDLGVQVLPDGARLDGMLIDADGAPVQGAEITLLRPAFLMQAVEARTHTDAAGRFTLEGLAMGVNLTLEARASGEAPVQQQVNVPPDAPVTLRLGAGDALVLRVLGPDGAPLPAGEAQVVDFKHRLTHVAIREGAARVPQALGHTLVVQAPGCAAWAGVVSAQSAPGGQMQVSLLRESRVRGVARDTQGRRLPGLALAALSQTEPLEALALDFGAISDAEGRFELGGLSEGTWSLRAERAGLVPTGLGLQLQAGETRDVELVFASGGSVAGHVVTSLGADVPGAVVRAGPITAAGPHVTADGEGRFVLAGLPPGPTWIGLPDGTGSQEVQVVADEITPVELVVPATAFVSGRVTSAGRALAGYVVSASTGKSSGPGPYRDVTDADGRYELADLKPGPLRVGVSDAGGRFLRAEELVLTDGEQRRLDFELVAMTLRIAVRSAEDGQPIPGAAVSYSEQANFNAVRRETDASGELVLEHVSKPSLWIRASAPGRLPAETTATLPDSAGELTVQLDLPRSGAIEGVVRLADLGAMPVLSVVGTGPPLATAPGGAATAPAANWNFGGAPEPPSTGDVRRTDVQRDGRFLLDQLPPGRWRVAVTQWVQIGSQGAPRELDVATVDVVAGKTTSVNFTAQPAR